MIGEETSSSYSPDQAFVSGLAGHELFGLPLAPFSLSRKVAAQTMACMAPASFTPAAYVAFRTNLSYPGVHHDVMCILWLCTLPDKITNIEDFKAGAFTPDRALRHPDDAVQAARKWAESVGLDNMASAAYEAAWKTFLTLVFAIDASLFDVEVEKTGHPALDAPLPKEKPGLRKSRSSSPRSRSRAGKASVSSGTR